MLLRTGCKMGGGARKLFYQAQGRLSRTPFPSARSVTARDLPAKIWINSERYEPQAT
ncbi:hypothetical protein Pla111_28340 [Botrimarina hoheduenensis]|uniref:Uncharacterized protein n=1 Tax=Botrimarina hoheduenensis TaxID=2528000 RepID=A0A5C5VXS7_9BACT|nr:hypothetical protein Pla111_28340 [Botrimarina hoheduenensis]